MAENVLSTRVDAGSWKRPIQGSFAHGPAKSWGKIGATTTVSCTVRVETLREARERGMNLSATLQATLERLLGGGDLAKIDEELRALSQRVGILEAARERLLQRERESQDAAAQEKAKEREILRIAEEFVRRGRQDVARVHNLAWLESRVEGNPLLKGLTTEGVLDLVLASIRHRPGTSKEVP